jgi:hypothetical protein
MIGFAFQNYSQRDDGFVFSKFRSALNEEWNLERAGSPCDQNFGSRIEGEKFRTGVVHEGLQQIPR